MRQLMALLTALIMTAGGLMAKGGGLISAEEALKLHGKSDVVFVMGDSLENFKEGHIPGSQHMESHGLQCTDFVGRMECPPLYMCVDEAEEFVGERGIGNDTLVIAYDDYRGPNATGIYHFFLIYGHSNVKILNGGLEAWKAAGGEVATGEPRKPAAKRFSANVDKRTIATKADMLEASNHITDLIDRTGSREGAEFALIDTRSMEEAIAGRKVDNVARGGHVPGATLMEWIQISGQDEMLSYPSDPEVLRERLERAGITPDKTIYTYCHVGAGRGSYYYVLLHELLGYPNVKVYTGGWNEWGNDMNLPIRR